MKNIYKCFKKGEEFKYNFYLTPKDLLRGEEFTSLDLGAKLIYSILLTRLAISNKNDWVDNNEKLFIVYSIEDIIDDSGSSRATIIRHLNSLENFGLIERKRRGLGMKNIIYINDFEKKNLIIR